MPPEVCPNCGADVPRNAKACPECGADESTGWAEDAQQATAADLGLPEEDFDYDEFVKKEFGGGGNPATGNAIWWVTGLVLFIILLAGAVRLFG